MKGSFDILLYTKRAEFMRKNKLNLKLLYDSEKKMIFKKILLKYVANELASA